MTRMRRVNTCTREPNGEMYDPEHSGQIKTGGEWALQVPSASRVALRRHPPTPSTHALIWDDRIVMYAKEVGLSQSDIVNEAIQRFFESR